MPTEFEPDTGKAFVGRTLFSKQGSKGMKPTAVYFSPKHAPSDRALNVVLWLHGFYVKDHKFLLQEDRSRVREQVRDSSKDVVVIAPFLGYEYANAAGDFEGNYSTDDLAKTNWGEQYLDEVLAALAAFPGEAATPAFTIKNLVIACHSGGGAGMRKLIGNLGKHRSMLRECWGLDCLYGAKASPDDATFWHDLMLSANALPLFFVYGPSTIRQSVKLDLMGQGLATSLGNRALPNTHPPMTKLHVDIGQALAVRTDRLMFPERGKAAAHARAVKSNKGVFVKQAAESLKESVSFDKDIHYIIARDGFKARLNAVTF